MPTILKFGSESSAFDLPALPTPLTKKLVKNEFVILVSLGKYFDGSSDTMSWPGPNLGCPGRIQMR